MQSAFHLWRRAGWDLICGAFELEVDYLMPAEAQLIRGSKRAVGDGTGRPRYLNNPLYTFNSRLSMS